MSSDYLNWKYRDVKPDAPAVYTKAELRRNWWHYHWLHVLLAVIAVIALLDIGRRALHIGETLPDITFAYAGSAILPEETVKAFEGAAAACASDINGDGKAVVRLVQYRIGEDDDADSPDPAAAPAPGSVAGISAAGQSSVNLIGSSVALMADLESCDSAFFLLEDPDAFQEKYDVLEPSGPQSSSRGYIRLSGCPVLFDNIEGTYHEELLTAAFDGENKDLLGSLYMARRVFRPEDKFPQAEALLSFWNSITKGTN